MGYCKMVKISYVELTARTDYPALGRPDLHLWEPSLQTLARQTFKDFEYIVVDVFYDERPNYFKQHNYGLRIKHIPSAPNIWYDLGLAQGCHQVNKGIIHSDGEIIFVNGDSFMYPPQFMEKLWKHYQEGHFALSGFGSDVTYYLQEIFPKKRSMRKATRKGIKISLTTVVPTGWYRFLGFEGKLHMHERYMNYFGKTDRDKITVPPDQYYGASVISLEAALKTNGFDMNFDGDKAYLSDCDMGIRLALAGYGNKLTMFRDTYCVEALAETKYHPKIRTPGIKCNYALMRYNQRTGRYRANEPLSESDIEWVINNLCLKGECGDAEACRRYNPHLYPFWVKKEKKLYEYWKKHQLPINFDLELEREMRINGEDYTEGTFINIQ